MSDFCFFINDSATTEIYTYSHTLSRHDALPILARAVAVAASLTAHSSEARVVQRSAISSVDWWDAAEIVTKASSRRPSGGSSILSRTAQTGSSVHPSVPLRDRERVV